MEIYKVIGAGGGMGSAYDLFKELFESVFDSDMTSSGMIFGDGGTIIDYESNELYDLLMAEGIPISSINQVMKLHELGYPLSISSISTLSTNDLRDIVKHCNFSKNNFTVHASHKSL